MKKLLAFFKMIPCFLMILSASSNAAKLAIVIDDFGYRDHNEKQVILFSPLITVAVLPHSPNAARIATYAHQNGNDVIIHLPMTPFGKQPLEVDTLTPAMSEDEIHRIMSDAIKKVPYAIGINNHMGSLMTSDLAGMQKVMRSLSQYELFFLDSRTIVKTQAIIAAKEYRVPTVARDVFLDDSQDEESVAHQFDLAIKAARKNGSAVAIGHPYNSTIKVLKAKLADLPDDIELVKVSSLVIQPEKIKLIDLFERYKTQFEQSLFDFLLLKKSQE